jgi:hypothetical protein
MPAPSFVWRSRHFIAPESGRELPDGCGHFDLGGTLYYPVKAVDFTAVRRTQKQPSETNPILKKVHPCRVV